MERPTIKIASTINNLVQIEAPPFLEVLVDGGDDLDEGDDLIDSLLGVVLTFFIFGAYRCNNRKEILADNAKAAMVFVHGYGEYTGRYDEFFEIFVENGISVFTLDLQGHGKSDGDRVHVIKFEDYVNDVLQYVSSIKPKIGKLPLFLMGNSMGGCISAFVSLKEKSFKGILYISPLFGALPEIAKPHLVAISDILAFLVPKLPVPGEKLNLSKLTHSKYEYDKFSNDPLCYHGNLKVNQANELYKATLLLKEHAKSYDRPFFIAQSEDDHAVDPQAAQDFYDNSISNDKKITIYKGTYHHLVGEPEEFGGGGKKATQDLLNWILERI